MENLVICRQSFVCRVWHPLHPTVGTGPQSIVLLCAGYEIARQYLMKKRHPIDVIKFKLVAYGQTRHCSTCEMAIQ